MSESKIKTDLCSPVSSYKEILQKFDFAQPFMDDPDSFNSNSDASRNFLIQAFAFIHPDFHYLSFLNKEIDQEIIRAAEILQILPVNNNKGDKLFDNLSDSEVKMFWRRLFSLLNCKKNDDFCVGIIRTSQEKFSFFKDISKILDYVDHELPVVKEKTLSKETLNKEIEKWNNLPIKCCHAQEVSSILNYDAPDVEHINIEQLLMDLKQVTLMLKNANFPIKINKPENLEFFSNFTSLTQNIDQHVANLKEINSPFLDELHHKMVSETKLIHSSSLYFLKRCCNFFKMLQNKNKFSI